jgi:hypothetical protein
MTVRIEKPALNLREEINRLDKPTGIAGEAMLRAETPQEQFDLIGAGRRNMIINGDFKVSQRGDYTSATTITNGTYYLDRCVSYAGNVGGTVQDMGGSIKHTATSSTVGYLGLEQKIEDYSRLGGETITVSAEVKSNHSSAQIMIYDSAYRDGVHHSGSGDWEKLTHTFTVNTSLSRLWVQVWIADSASSLNVNMTSGDYIEVRNFQVERGKIATPFEHRSYVEELALCQRYFYAFQSPNDTLGENGFMGTAYGADTLYCPIFLPVQMRAIPGIVSGGQWTIRRGNNFAFTGAFGQQRGGQNTMIIAQSVPSGSGINVTDAVWVEPYDNTAYLYFQAEL